MENTITQKEERDGVVTEVVYKEVSATPLTTEQQLRDILAEHGVMPENQSDIVAAIMMLFA